MKRLVLSTVILGALSITFQASEAANQGDQNLCVADKKIGFEYNNRLDAYDAATFQAGNNFTTSLSFSQDSAFKFDIIEPGNSRPPGACKYGFNDWGILFCDLMPAEFRFNKDTKRFITMYAGGYDDPPSCAYLEIGKFSSL